MARIDMLYRYEPLDAALINRANKTLPISFSSETPAVQRADRAVPAGIKAAAGLADGESYIEILDHSPENVDLSLLKNRGAFLDQHNDKDQLGVVEEVAVVSKVGRAVIRMGNDRAAQTRFTQMVDGIRPHISAGYKYTRFLRCETLANGRTAYRFAWKGLEISSVAVPADPTIGVGRSDLATRDFMRNTSLLDQISTNVARAISGTRRPADLDYPDFSLVKFMARAQDPEAREMAEAIPTLGGEPTSAPLHLSALAPRMGRASTVGDFSSGGALVGTQLAGITQLALNRSILINSGVEIIDGQRDNYSLAKITTAPTVQTLTEVAPVAASEIMASQDALKPCRISAQIRISRQLLRQGGPMAENAIRKAITDALSVALDRACLFGDGSAGEPLGLFNVPGVGSMLFDGPASWAKIVAAEQALADANLDFGRMAWALSPSSRARWKTIPKIGATNFPQFLIQDGTCNEFPVLASNQLSARHQGVFAAWDSIQLILWGPPGGAIDILFDPYSEAAKAEVIVTAVLFANVLLRYPQAVIVSADAGNL